MGLYVSTTGTDVVISELGITISHPTTDQDLGEQFTSEDLQNAPSLTSSIRAGDLVWRKIAGGAVQPPTDYDADFLEIEEENTGPGRKADRVITFKDIKAGVTESTDFSGSPKTAVVAFTDNFPDNNYAVLISGSDKRSWSSENLTLSGFTINANANQPLTGRVYWSAEYQSN